MRIKAFDDLAVSTESLEVGSLDQSRVATGQFVSAGHELDITARPAAKQEVLDVRCHIAICHPRKTSIGVAVLRSARTASEGTGYGVLVIDLYREGFDPVLTTEEWRSDFPDTARNVAGLRDHVEAMQWAESLALIFSTGMYGPPELLKGWFDRFLLPGAAFKTLQRWQWRAVDGHYDIGITVMAVVPESRHVPQHHRTRSVSSPLPKQMAADVQSEPQYGRPARDSFPVAFRRLWLRQADAREVVLPVRRIGRS